MEVGEGVTQWKAGEYATKFYDPGPQRHIQVIASRSRQAYLAPNHRVTTAGSAGIMHVRATTMFQIRAWMLTQNMQVLTLSSSRLHPSTVRRITHQKYLLIMSRLTGTLTRWHLHPAEWLHRLPDSVSFEEGALCEPLAVALAGIERSGLRLGDSTLIWYLESIQSYSYLPDDFSVVLGRSVWFPCSLRERLVQSPLLLQTCSRAASISQRNWFLVSVPCSSSVDRH